MKWALTRGWTDLQLRSKGFAVVAVPLCMLFLAGAVFFVTAQQDRRVQRQVLHDRAVLQHLNTVSSLVVDSDSADRGYVLTRDTAHLLVGAEIERKLDDTLGALDTLVGGPGLVGVGELRTLVGERTRLPVAPLGTLGADAITDWLRDKKGSTDEIRLHLREVEAAQSDVLAKSRASRNRWRDLGSWGVGASLLIGCIGGVLAARMFSSGVVRRVAKLEEDATHLATGEPLGPPDTGRDELGLLSRTLHQIVGQRMNLESELREARDAADAANSAKSEFLSRMSHELRTPMNSVLGFAQLLEMDELTESQRSSVHQITRGGRHLLDLINEVLDISRIESGTLALSPEPVLLRDVVEEVADLIAPLASARGVSVGYPIGAGCEHYVLADRQRVKQVLLNLLANAVKYNRPGGRVDVSCEPAGDGMLSMAISDTGVGIAPEHLARLFIAFDRLGAEQSDIEGTGVGLALSKRLVEAMDGTLDVRSAIGEGSVFTVTLQRADSPTPREVTHVAELEEPRLRKAESRKVLYIEDNLSNLRLMERVVERRPGFTLLHAPEGWLGLGLARSHRPDVVLLDLHLPDATGADVLAQLRADPATASVPVYIVSADATQGQVERLMAAGADGYLTKPIDVGAVLAILDGVGDGDHGVVSGIVQG